MSDGHNGQHSHREATLYYHKSTSCITSEKKWNTKKDNDKFMMHVLYVCTAVGEKAHLEMKQNQTVKKSSL